MTREHFLLIFTHDVRECFMDGDFYVHILNTGYRVHKDSHLIREVRPCGAKEWFPTVNKSPEPATSE